MVSLEGIPKECIATTGNGIEYAEFSCLYPELEPFYTGFEKRYDPIPVLHWMQERPMVPVLACVLYALLIVVGRALMEGADAWKWRKVLAVWNLSLSVFSWIGMFRTLPHLIHNLTNMSLRDNLCTDPERIYGSGSSGLWVQLFVLSKFPELVDTFFIVIHKKPLIFLHWYHHVTVLLYCWHSYVTKSGGGGLFFATMNYSVHAVMYGYYFLMAIRMRPKWFNPMIITAFQISQMIVGVFITSSTFYYYMTDANEEEPCMIKRENNISAFLMYGSYLLLFLQFFIRRYFKVRVNKSKKA